MIKLHLFDIEGTTTDINFVHKVLFPYSKKHLSNFVLTHQDTPEVKNAIKDVRRTVKEEENRSLDNDEVIAELNDWIAQDRKHGALKEIQGLIWDVGYKNRDFTGHIYPDVKPFFENVLKSGAQIGIYSSGSVHAQKLIFTYSDLGDLTPMISYYFDTKVGGKREKESYLNIAVATGYEPTEIHFYSDIAQELVAAEAAGMAVTQLLRPGTQVSQFSGISRF